MSQDEYTSVETDHVSFDYANNSVQRDSLGCRELTTKTYVKAEIESRFSADDGNVICDDYDKASHSNDEHTAEATDALASLTLKTGETIKIKLENVSEENETNEEVFESVEKSQTLEIPTCAEGIPSDEDSEMVVERDEDGDTVLHTAIILQEINMVCMLIDVLRESIPHAVNARNCLYQTPLHIATLTRQAYIIQKLIESGASASYQDNRGRTPLHIACEYDDIEIVRILVSGFIRNNEENDLKSSSANDSQITGAIFPHNIVNFEGETCLHIAVKKMDTAMAKLLIQSGADVNFPDGKSHRTALHFAVENRDADMVTLLLQQDHVMLDCQTLNGETPLELAVIRQFHDIADLIHGAW